MITLAQAREIAYAWHGGGGSPLYSFASTSNDGTPRNITPDTVSEVNGNIRWCLFNGRTEEAKERPQLEELAAYLVANMPAQPEEEEEEEDDEDDDPFQLRGTHIYNVMMGKE